MAFLRKWILTLENTLKLPFFVHGHVMGNQQKVCSRLKLPVIVRMHQLDASVAWIKSDSKAILAIHTHMVAHNPRLSVTHNGHNTWKLHVSNVQMNDSGTYMCQINTDPMRSQMGNLDVKVPPDILNDEAPDGGVAPENGSVRLRCKATGIPEPTVMWRREDANNIVLRFDGGREKQ
ncbi:hypothetical protein L9F63_009397, partial [Diploptera punctata]